MILIGILSLLLFLFVLTVLVIIHELGHFIMARKFGIKVEEFGFGFPPRAFGIKKGETLYSINWLPIGGFVKLYGEDEAGGGRIEGKSQKVKVKTEDEERAFYAKSAWQRATVIVAGVVMNAALAAFIFYIFLGISGFKTQLPLIGEYTFMGVNQTNINEDVKDSYVTAISPDSPAAKAGMKPPVKIVSVNGKKITGREEFINLVNNNKGKQITIAWENINTQKKYSAQITPRISPPKNEGALGVGFFPLALLEYKTPLEKIFSGITYPINLLQYQFHVLAKIINFSVQEKTVEPVAQSVSGPVGILFFVGGTVSESEDAKDLLLQMLNMAGVLSISLAFFNILPIPALDGGRLFFILIEAIFGRKVNQKIESFAHSVGMIFLLGLILLITFKDLKQFIFDKLPIFP